MAPPISVRAHTVVLSRRGRVICIWIVYIRHGSVEVLQVTGSLVLRIILWCLVIVCFLSCSKSLTVTKSLPGSLCRPVHSAGYQRSSCWLCTVTVYITGGMMASGEAGCSRPELTVVGSDFAASCRHRGMRPSHT